MTALAVVLIAAIVGAILYLFVCKDEKGTKWTSVTFPAVNTPTVVLAAMVPVAPLNTTVSIPKKFTTMISIRADPVFMIGAVHG
ncbi:unnamed protein product [Nippostrongylus brasiliensis]|uniref:Transmembrane protein n=1 Tax=Nippostrongylus brasiliensis TaxID=27835 RepID=A0A0N4YLF5_NIPBR|nr:unnamed protein product [Nippostrongylus brasiliensis]